MFDTDARAPLLGGETVLQSFHADRATYIRDHVILAVIGSIGAMLALYWTGHPDYWVGAVAAVLAIAVRGGYLASDDLTARWDLTNQRLIGPQGRVVRLRDIDKLRALGSAVQVVTRGGDKHLIKYLADKDAVREAIMQHMTRRDR